MKPWVKAIGSPVLLVTAMGWMIAGARGQSATIPATTTRARELSAILPDLASPDVARRDAGQKALENVPADQFEAVAALAAAQTDPEAKARLESRVAEMLKQLTDKSSPAPVQAKALVAQLLALAAASQEFTGPQQQLIWDIGPLGDAALDPAQAALPKAKTELQRGDLVDAIGAVTTPAATQVLLELMSDKDDAIHDHAMISLAQRLKSEKVLPALAKALPQENSERVRIEVCMEASQMLGAPVGKPDPQKPDPQLLSLATQILQERLKNDRSGEARLWAAAGLAAAGDNSGLPELEKDALAMEADPHAALFADEGNLFWVEILMPALEKAAGQKFGPATLDPNPMGPKTSPLKLDVYYDNRKARLDAAVAWIKANPGTQPAGEMP